MVHAAQTAVLEHGDEANEITADELVLRICSPARRGQVVRLKSRKCSIGSAQNCTLRLAARGIHPVHCLIVRGQESTVIRCWAPDTRINGRSFTDTNLNVGDRLAIGPIEFEVLHTGTPRAQEPLETQPRSDVRDQSSQLDEQLKGIREEKQRWEKNLAAEKAELDRQRESLQKQHDELAGAADSLNKQRQEWEATRAKEESRSADDNARAERLRAELDAEKAELDRQRESLQKQCDELAGEADSLAKQRQEWEAYRAQEKSRSADDNARIAQLQEELASRRAEDSCADELPPTPISDEAPISLENVLRKMGMEEGETAARQAATHKNQDEEESLDDYMARLMDRVRTSGGSTPTIAGGEKDDYIHGASDAVPPSASPQSISQPPTARAVPFASEALEEKKSSREKLNGLYPRGIAPEKVESLSAMRELANVYAQTAIDRHAKRQFLHAARSKLLVAVVGLLSCGILLSLWWLLGERGVVFYGGLIAFMVALFWGFQFAVMSGKVASTKTPAKNHTESSLTDIKEGISNGKSAQEEQLHTG